MARVSGVARSSANTQTISGTVDIGNGTKRVVRIAAVNYNGATTQFPASALVNGSACSLTALSTNQGGRQGRTFWLEVPDGAVSNPISWSVTCNADSGATTQCFVDAYDNCTVRGAANFSRGGGTGSNVIAESNIATVAGDLVPVVGFDGIFNSGVVTSTTSTLYNTSDNNYGGEQTATGTTTNVQVTHSATCQWFQSVIALIPPASAPVLSSPTAAGGTLTGSGTVSTDTASGTLWWKVDTSATATDPGAGSEAGAGWSSQAVSASGSQSVNFGALAAGSGNYAHYLHVASGGRSSVANAGPFTVSAGSSNALRAMYFNTMNGAF